MAGVEVPAEGLGRQGCRVGVAAPAPRRPRLAPIREVIPARSGGDWVRSGSTSIPRDRSAGLRCLRCGRAARPLDRGCRCHWRGVLRRAIRATAAPRRQADQILGARGVSPRSRAGTLPWRGVLVGIDGPPASRCRGRRRPCRHPPRAAFGSSKPGSPPGLTGISLGPPGGCCWLPSPAAVASPDARRSAGQSEGGGPAAARASWNSATGSHVVVRVVRVKDRSSERQRIDAAPAPTEAISGGRVGSTGERTILGFHT